MSDVTTTYHTRVRGDFPALDAWADASGRAMRAAHARLARGEDAKLVARTGYQGFGLGSKNLDHVLVDLRGRRDGAVASARFARDGLLDRVARAGKRVDRRGKTLARTNVARAKAQDAIDALRARLAGAVAKAPKGSAAVRSRAEARCEALRAKIAAKADDVARLAAEIDRLRFAVHQGRRHAGVLADGVAEAERRVEAPRLCFGSRGLFHEQHDLEANGHADHAAWLETWRHARSDDVYVVGDAGCPSGNGFVRATAWEDGTLDLEVRLPPAAAAHATRTVAHAGRTIPVLDMPGVRFPHGGDRVRAAIADGGPVTWRFKRDARGWKLFTAFTREAGAPATTSLAGGCLSVDVNHGHWAVARVSPTGDNLETLRIPCLTYGRGADGTCDAVRKAAAGLAELAAKLGLPVVCERLDFTARKRTLADLSPRRARLLSSFAYSQTLDAIARACTHRRVHLRRVDPAFTSIIARVSIAPRLGLSVHAGAAVAVGRRAMGFSERYPRVAEVVVDLGRSGHVALAPPERMGRRHVWSGWNRFAVRMKAAREALARAGRRARSADARKGARAPDPASAGRDGPPPPGVTGGTIPGRADLRLWSARRARNPPESCGGAMTIT